MLDEGKKMSFIAFWNVIEWVEFNITLTFKQNLTTFQFHISIIQKVFTCLAPELRTLEWWLSRLMLHPLFFLISRLT